MRSRVSVLSIAALAAVVSLAADAAWNWSGSFGDKAVSLMIIGDIQVHSRRADPATAFVRMRETLKQADIVYANLEGVLVKSTGDSDIPDKKGWTHPGPGAVIALKSIGIPVVGTANNVAYGRDNILKTVALLDANGIAHTGSGRYIDDAHKPAIVERKGVKIGFLQYTARWYREDEQIATATAPGVARLRSVDGLTVETGDLQRVQDDIRKLRPQVDVIVVSHHNRDGATPVQFGAVAASARRSGGEPADRTKSEEYQKQFAHAALDSGADLVFGHGTHTIQGVELYNGKPILYAIGHSNFDQPGYEKSKDGLVIRAVIQNKAIRRVSFVPVTRDENNDVMMIDPTNGEGARLLEIVKGVSPGVALKIEGREVVLLDRPAPTSTK
jgi:poly-gamma-glutamate synthesis protein (capsule biosynthesis protein)